MSTSRQITKSSLRNFLDDFSRSLPLELARVELTGPKVGDQVAVEWNPLNGISYDPRNDLVCVDFQNGPMEHRVAQPLEFWVEEECSGIRTISLKCADGLQHLILLKTPLRLPAPID